MQTQRNTFIFQKDKNSPKAMKTIYRKPNVNIKTKTIQYHHNRKSTNQKLSE